MKRGWPCKRKEFLSAPGIEHIGLCCCEEEEEENKGACARAHHVIENACESSSILVKRGWTAAAAAAAIGAGYQKDNECSLGVRWQLRPRLLSYTTST